MVDYYALAGILTSPQVMEQRYMLGSQRLMERLAGLGPGGAAADEAYEAYWRERPDRLERLKQAKAASDLVQAKDFKGLAELARKHADSVAEKALDASQSFEARVMAQKKRLQALARAAEAPAIPPRAMIPVDAEKPTDESIRLAGERSNRMMAERLAGGVPLDSGTWDSLCQTASDLGVVPPTTQTPA